MKEFLWARNWEGKTFPLPSYVLCLGASKFSWQKKDLQDRRNTNFIIFMCPVYRKEGKFKGVVRLEAYITEKASNSSHLNNEKRVWAFGDYKL